MNDLYQDLILEHGQSPRGAAPLHNATKTLHEVNTLCGDQVTLYITHDDSTLQDVRCVTQGCVLSRASGSLLCETLKGKSLKDADAISQAVIAGATSKTPTQVELGKLRALGGVAKYPARVKCVTMVWHALQKGISTNTSAQ